MDKLAGFASQYVQSHSGGGSGGEESSESRYESQSYGQSQGYDQDQEQSYGRSQSQGEGEGRGGHGFSNSDDSGSGGGDRYSTGNSGGGGDGGDSDYKQSGGGSSSGGGDGQEDYLDKGMYNIDRNLILRSSVNDVCSCFIQASIVLRRNTVMAWSTRRRCVVLTRKSPILLGSNLNMLLGKRICVHVSGMIANGLASIKQVRSPREVFQLIAHIYLMTLVAAICSDCVTEESTAAPKIPNIYIYNLPRARELTRKEHDSCCIQ